MDKAIDTKLFVSHWDGRRHIIFYLVNQAVRGYAIIQWFQPSSTLDGPKKASQ